MVKSNIMTSKVEQGRGHKSEDDQDVSASFVMVKKKGANDHKQQLDTKFAFTITHQPMVKYNKDWIIYQGCLNHLTSNKEKLQNMTKYKGNQVLVTTNNSRLPITHVGKMVILPCFSENGVCLKDVYHLLGMKKNLLSMFQLTKSRKYIMFSLEDVKVSNKLKVTSSPIMEGQHMDYIYVMFIDLSYVSKTKKNEMVDLWLAHLRHVGYNSLKE